MFARFAERFRGWTGPKVAQFHRDDEGATAVEYGMLVALIAAVIVTIVATLGTDILNAFTTISNQI